MRREVLLADLGDVVVTAVDDALEDVLEDLEVALVEHVDTPVDAPAESGYTLLPVLKVLLLELLKPHLVGINNARKSVESLPLGGVSALGILLAGQRLFLDFVATAFS